MRQEASVADNSALLETYRLLVADIDRYRDWPIKVLTFTSALHYAVIATIAVKELALRLPAQLALTACFGLLSLFTLYYFVRCHRAYLELRNVQVRMNRSFGLNHMQVADVPLFPAEWFAERRVSICVGFWGWGFYACYTIVLLAISLIVVWQLGFAWSSSSDASAA